MTKLAFPISFLFAFNLFAYQFGKNKVQYRDFNWIITSSEHFDVYYYEGGEELARFAIPVLEKAFSEYSNFLGVEIDDKIPVLIYNCQKDFMQTNVTLELLEESVGGFTEIFKNRVVVPFNGSYYDFWHVLRHELVHVFQFNILFRRSITGASTSLYSRLPLWVIEGMAEYFSLGWDDRAETFMRDLLINDMVVPLTELGNCGGYEAYKEGQAFYFFVENVYGREKIREFIYQLRLKRNVDDVCKKVFGKSLEDLDRAFKIFFKKRYYPLLGEFSLPTEVKRLTDHRKDGGFMNVAPTLSPTGQLVAIVSDRNEKADVFLISPVDGKVVKKLVKGEQSPDFEYLHLFRPGLSFSPDGTKLALLSLGRGRELLHIIDVKKGKVVRKYTLNLDAAYDPCWSPDGRLIALSGVKNGQADIYLLHLDSGELERLTEDKWDDRNPSFSKDGESILFVSDRKEGEVFRFSSYAVFAYDLETGMLEQLTPHLGNISNPLWLNDSTLLMVVPYKRSLNLALYNLGSDSLFLLTDFLTEVSHPSVDSEGEKLVFTLLWEGGYDVFALKAPFSAKKSIPLSEVASFSVRLLDYLERKRTYTIDFSVDWLQGMMEVSTFYGLNGALTIGLSDALGNHRIIFTSDLYQDIANSNFQFVYLYLPKRADFGFTFYQYWTFYVYPYDLVITEKKLGFEGLVLYPFDKFKRLEIGGLYIRPKRYYYYYDPLYDEYVFEHEESKNVLAGYLGFVLDDALYTFFGPVSGNRVFVGMEKTLLSQLDYGIYYADLRKYFRITKRSCFALRFIGGISEGRDAPPFWLGGPENLRGYDYYEFSGTRLILFNAELRVPFLDCMKLAFPIPLKVNNIRGVCFFDAGATWFKGDKFEPFDGLRFKDLKGDIGVGLRLYLGLFNLKFDIARKTDLSRISPGAVYRLSLGVDY